VSWSGVALATGYRVARATSPNGPYSITADLDVASGRSTKDASVKNLFYSGDNGFVYIEVLTDSPANGLHRYYRVTAYNAAGDGPSSAVVCGAPVGISTC
jgi:hypothetical protein